MEGCKLEFHLHLHEAFGNSRTREVESVVHSTEFVPLSRVKAWQGDPQDGELAHDWQ